MSEIERRVIEIDWKKPDYRPVLMERSRRLYEMRKGSEDENASYVASLKAYYREHPWDFINDWGMTVDPRNAELGLETTVPFVLFPRQLDLVEWLYARWRAREDGLVEKSRDAGLSWLAVAFGVWMWVFYADTAIGYGSRKEEYVDKIGDPKSLLWKARAFIRMLPVEFIPDGYDEKRHAPSMRIVNPDNGAVIFGEAGDNIGRGARASIYFKDESAHYEHDDLIDAALSQTSNCKIDISSVNGEGNAFARRRFSGNVSVFEFDWRDDPRKDDAWYRKQVATLDSVIVAQEIDRDYMASVSNAFIDSAMIEAAMSTPVNAVEALGEWIIGVDAAHEGNDESVIHARRGRLNLTQVVESKLDGIDLCARVESFARMLEVSSGVPVCGIVIELDGPGVSCYDQLKRGRYSDRIKGVHTGARQRDNKHWNLRARLWGAAQEYLKEGGVCMDRDKRLKMQISSMRYSYKDGLLLMMDKKLYKSQFGFSPDRADAFMLTFADVRSTRNNKSNYRPTVRVVQGYENRKKNGLQGIR